MKFLSVLPVVGALIGAASASPLEPRGNNNGMHSYRQQANWDHDKWYTWSCKNSDWDDRNRCCKHEKKCWYDPWECRWECCEAREWDWHNDCPSWYSYKKHDSKQKYDYYGGGSEKHHNWYNDDCKKGHGSQYTRGGKYKHHGN